MRFFRHAIVFALIAFPVATSAAQQSSGEASAEIRQALEEGEAGQDIAFRRYVLGARLTPDSKASHVFDAEKGETYLAIGACDEETCGDIDLVVKDAAGNVLSNDEVYGADPFVVFAPRKSGRVSVILAMKECDEDACEYGLGFYTLAERQETSN